MILCEICGEASATYKAKGLPISRCSACKEKGMTRRNICLEPGCTVIPQFNLPGNKMGIRCKKHKTEAMEDVRALRCKEAGCGIISSYGPLGTKKGLFCSSHKKPGMVDVKNRKCESSGCTRQPAYNLPEGFPRWCFEHKPEQAARMRTERNCEEPLCTLSAGFGFRIDNVRRFCKSHSLEGMVNLVAKSCSVEGCGVASSWGYLGRASVCSSHKEDGMENVIKKKCISCSKVPVYNYPKESRGTHCKLHKLTGMVNVVTIKCKKEGCAKHPLFGPQGTSKGLYCLKHREGDMVDVKSPLCYYTGCSKRRNFGTPGGNREFCATHRTPGMIDLVNKRCPVPGCSSQPNYGPKGSRKGLRCGSHKKKGWVHVSRKNCDEEGCEKVPCFNYPGSLTGRFCKEHSRAQMINVKITRCGTCPVSASYGLLFGKPTRCAKHKTPGMLHRSKINPKCLHAPTLASKKCPNAPYYAPPGSSYPERCEDHALEDDVNVIEQECLRCHLTYLIPEGEELCQGCKDYDSPKIVHAKELRVAKVLEAAGIETSQADTPVEWGCSKKRPDFVIDAPLGFVIVLEVDENQHHSYARECEMARMGQIAQDLGGLPVIFVRYNPDAYTDHLGVRVRGGAQNPGREAHLLDFLRRLLRKKLLPPPVSLYHLFYDRYDDHLGPQGVELDFYEFAVEELARVVYYPDPEEVEGEVEGEVEESATEVDLEE